MRKNSVKNRRVNDEVMRVMAQIIRDIKDPRVSPMTSVMDVEVATDLKTCKVFITVLGTEEEKKNTMTGLKNAKGFVRSELARRVNMRNTPEIRFIEDDSIEYGVTMGHKIDLVRKADEEAEKVREEQGIDINDTSAYIEDTEE